MPHRQPFAVVLALLSLVALGGCGKDNPAPPAWFEPTEPLVTTPDELEQWRFVPVEGALCANGQQSGFFANITDASDDVLIFLLGGGICYDDLSCGLPPHRTLIEEGLGPDPLAWWEAHGHEGVLSRESPDNPFADASYIVLPHCTVDFHAANKISNYEGFPPLHQVGYRNVQLAMNTVVPTFADPDRRVTIAGFSAGGVGTLANYDQIASAFESYGHVPPFLINDGGPIQRAPFFSEASNEAIREGWSLDETIGTWCESCATEGYSETLRVLHERHPGLQSAQVCAYADNVVMLLYSLFDLRSNPRQFTREDSSVDPFVGSSMRAGLQDLASWSESLETKGAHRSFFYDSTRHGALTVGPLSLTPGLGDFLGAMYDPAADWQSVIPRPLAE